MLIERSDKNPILKPNINQSWEAQAAFNGCPVEKNCSIFLLYRALSLPHYHSLAHKKLAISSIGIAQSRDGINFSNRQRFIVSEHSWERFGCEDPRVTKLDSKYYVFYTALSTYPFRPEGIRIGLAISKDLETIQEKHPITPFNAKAMALFPERINGKIWALLTVNTDRPPSEVCLASFNTEKEIWSQEYWQTWYQDFQTHVLPLKRKPEDFVEVGTPPIKTKNGWLLLYSYIRNYFSSNKIFGIEAVLLDSNDPHRIIARTDYPILTPEEYYERIGIVPNIVFPSGALIRQDRLYLYYGAADTTCSLAFIDLPTLLEKMLRKGKKVVRFSRYKQNPIIAPIKNNAWEAKATFNPAALYLDEKVHILYRAMSEDNTSTFGYAQSKDGIHIDYRSPKPVYTPRQSFEQKLVPNGNSGCEDPRLTNIGNKIYVCYTAFDGKNYPRVALGWITTKDFLAQRWNWSKPVLISPPNFDDKDACVFPEKIGGKYAIIHRSGDDMDLSFHTTLNFDNSIWLEEYRWVSPRKGWWDSKKVGVSATPIKTAHGWLILYHGVSEESIYRVGALLCTLDNPTNIIARTDEPIFEPKTTYEKKGQVANVVFPCGAVLLKDKLFMYYGGADSVVGVATIKLKKILENLKFCKC